VGRQPATQPTVPAGTAHRAELKRRAAYAGGVGARAYPGPAGHGDDPLEGGHAQITTELQGSDRRGYPRVVTVSITTDLEKARREHFTDYELANIIRHELRHAEIHLGPLEGEDLSTMEKVDQSQRRRARMDKQLDMYVPSDLPTSKGTGTQTGDDRNHDFQVEIGLRMSEDDENAARQAAREKIELLREQIRARQSQRHR